MRRSLVTLSLAMFAVSAAAAAVDSRAPGQPNPAALCKTQRDAMGTAVFAATYGTNADRSNAFGKCVSRQRKELGEVNRSAAAACRAERTDPSFPATHDGKTFDQFYGTGKKGRNALGKCISAKARSSAVRKNQETINAAKACKRERAASPAAFRAKYGTNTNKKNAFGKCVSAKTGGR